MPISEWIKNIRKKAGHELLMMPSASAIVKSDTGKLLLHQRSDNGLWSLPGGAIDPGEEPAEAVIREVWEETGLRVEPVRIVGVYGGKKLVGQYGNGDKFGYVSIAFECRVIGGEIDSDNDESLDVRWFNHDDLPENIMPVHRIRIEHGFNRDTPFFALSQD
jgi:8-oxo-dGTP diphosphatase